MGRLRAKDGTVDPISILGGLLKTQEALVSQEWFEPLEYFHVSVEVNTTFAVKSLQSDMVRQPGPQTLLVGFPAIFTVKITVVFIPLFYVVVSQHPAPTIQASFVQVTLLSVSKPAIMDCLRNHRVQQSPTR